MIEIFILLIFFGVSATAQAYGTVNGKVKLVRIDRSGLGMIEFDRLIGNTPASCRAEPYTSHLSFDVRTDGGWAIYSIALLAAASGKTITAIGLGVCEEYSNIVESMSYGVFHSE